MPRLTNAQLHERIAELERENAELLGSAAAVDAAPHDPSPRRRPWGWALLSTVLIIVGAVLAPLALTASWAKTTLTDTDSFVATYEPLLRQPSVQNFITDKTIEVVDQNIDIQGLTSDVIDGITELGTPPLATKALEALKVPAATGVRSLIRSAVASFVASDAFADVWQRALRVSHEQLVATMQNDESALVALGSDGSIGVQLGPIVAEVKQVLLDRGITFASAIPAVDRTIVVAQSEAIPAVRVAYVGAVAAGLWLQWLALAFLVAGVLVARRRSRALIGAAVGLAVSMAVLLIGFAIGHTLMMTSLTPTILPARVAELLFSSIAAGMQQAAVAVLVLAFAVAVVGWLAGPFDLPRKLRGLGAEGVATLRRAAERRGITTGRAGERMYSLRILTRSAIAVIAAAVIVFTRPLTTPLVVWTLVLALLAVLVLELVQRPARPTRDEPLPAER